MIAGRMLVCGSVQRWAKPRTTGVGAYDASRGNPSGLSGLLHNTRRCHGRNLSCRVLFEIVVDTGLVAQRAGPAEVANVLHRSAILWSTSITAMMEKAYLGMEYVTGRPIIERWLLHSG